MPYRRFYDLLALAAVGYCSVVVTAQAPESYPPGDEMLLVQSELDYLENADRRIDVKIEQATPAAALQVIRERSGLTIDVKGTLPAGPELTVSMRGVSVREVLKWYGKKVGAVYRVERGDRVVVIPVSRKIVIPVEGPSEISGAADAGTEKE